MKHLKKEKREAVGEVKKHETPHGQPQGRAGTTEPDLNSRTDTSSYILSLYSGWRQKTMIITEGACQESSKQCKPSFVPGLGEKYLQWPHDGSLAQTQVNLGAFPGSSPVTGSQAVGAHLPSCKTVKGPVQVCILNCSKTLCSSQGENNSITNCSPQSTCLHAELICFKRNLCVLSCSPFQLCKKSHKTKTYY